MRAIAVSPASGWGRGVAEDGEDVHEAADYDDHLTAPAEARYCSGFDIDDRYRIRISKVTTRQTGLLKGTLDLLILKTLALEPRHGVGVADRIGQLTGGTFRIGAGSLFPALHRLEQHGCITGEWGMTPDGHRAKYYRLTPPGQRQLAAEKRQWAMVAGAIGRVLEAD